MGGRPGVCKGSAPSGELLSTRTCLLLLALSQAAQLSGHSLPALPGARAAGRCTVPEARMRAARAQVLDEYAAQRRGAMFVLWFGAVDEEQHGFLEHGDIILDIHL